MKRADLFLPLSQFTNLVSYKDFGLILPISPSSMQFTINQIVQLAALSDADFYEQRESLEAAHVIRRQNYFVEQLTECPLKQVSRAQWEINWGPDNPRMWARINKPVDREGRPTSDVSVRVIRLRKPRHDLAEFNRLYRRRFTDQER